MQETGPSTGIESPDGFAAISRTLYEELREAARRQFGSERRGHTLQPTAVVNEACIRIAATGLPDIPREQKLALAGRVLRQVLIDHARSRDAEKRGGRELRIDLDPDTLADSPTTVDFEPIQRALERLRGLSPRQAEVVTLRIFSGMTMEQIAGVLGVSKRSAEGDWTVARTWLRRELAPALAAAGEGQAE